MKRYLMRGWIYSRILDGRKLILLGSFLLFYLGLAFNLPSISQAGLGEKSNLEEKKICLEEKVFVKPTH